jgi:hypothetical protein
MARTEEEDEAFCRDVESVCADFGAWTWSERAAQWHASRPWSARWCALLHCYERRVREVVTELQIVDGHCENISFPLVPEAAREQFDAFTRETVALFDREFLASRGASLQITNIHGCCIQGCSCPPDTDFGCTTGVVFRVATMSEYLRGFVM